MTYQEWRERNARMTALERGEQAVKRARAHHALAIYRLIRECGGAELTRYDNVER